MLGFFLMIGPCEMVFVLSLILATLFWIWMLVDCATNYALDTGEKVVWILIILVLHFLGALLYFVFGRKRF